MSNGFQTTSTHNHVCDLSLVGPTCNLGSSRTVIAHTIRLFKLSRPTRQRISTNIPLRTHLAAFTCVLHTCTFALRQLPSEPLLQRRFGGTGCCTAQEQRRTSQNSPRRTQMAMSTPEQSAPCLGWSRSLREQRLLQYGTTVVATSGCRNNNLEFHKEKWCSLCMTMEFRMLDLIVNTLVHRHQANRQYQQKSAVERDNSCSVKLGMNNSTG